jgi:hypothetical protein
VGTVRVQPIPKSVVKRPIGPGCGFVGASGGGMGWLLGWGRELVWWFFYASRFIRRRSWKRAIPWSITALVIVLAGVGFWNLRRPNPQPISRLVVTTPTHSPTSARHRQGRPVGLPQPDQWRITRHHCSDNYCIWFLSSSAFARLMRRVRSNTSLLVEERYE